MTDLFTRLGIAAAESGWVPDALVRAAIRHICAQRLKEVDGDPETRSRLTKEFLVKTSTGPIAAVPEKANRQHYEVPAEFFQKVLGPALKYSCCYWPSASAGLFEAEQAALLETCRHAGLGDGQRILELGCGWGSLSLFVAQNYPQSHVLAISNSASQRAFIEDQAARRGLSNLVVQTQDINSFQPESRFDRVVSVEMFEHVRNHRELLRRISGWLEEDGKLLVHVFCGRGAPYTYENDGANDWMARNFFSGGVMPSDDLFLRYQNDLQVAEQWRWSGVHYQRTLEAWLALLDANRSSLVQLFEKLGERKPQRALQKWRMFLMACSELFGSGGGSDWWVSHYLFEHGKKSRI